MKKKKRTLADELLDLNARLLDDARSSGRDVCIAVAILVLPDGTERAAHYVDEYGDGEGLSMVRDFVAEVNETGQLRDGERLFTVLMTAPLTGAQWQRTDVLPRKA